MPDMLKMLEKAKTSKFSLWLVNFGMNRVVPFNKPHGFKIVKLTDTAIETMVPYKKRNLNHIKGIHACALATLSEFTSGAFLISKIGTKKYRMILKNLNMEYHYQGKTAVFAAFSLTDDQIREKIYKPLNTNETVDITCEVKAFDANNNHISTGNVTWQFKDWSKVRTRL